MKGSEARDAARHPVLHRTAHNKGTSRPNVSSAGDGKPAGACWCAVPGRPSPSFVTSFPRRMVESAFLYCFLILLKHS